MTTPDTPYLTTIGELKIGQKWRSNTSDPFRSFTESDRTVWRSDWVCAALPFSPPPVMATIDVDALDKLRYDSRQYRGLYPCSAHSTLDDDCAAQVAIAAAREAAS